MISQFKGQWDLTILDGQAPVTWLSSVTVGDVDGDGRLELLIGGQGALLWYRPCTGERGVVHVGGKYSVGAALHDIDGDGRLEIAAGKIASEDEGENNSICWYKMGSDISQPWTEYLVDPAFEPWANAHDMIFADVDGDGEKELVAIRMYTDNPGINIYKKNADPTLPWRKYEAHAGTAAEGLSVADLDGDGQMEIVLGPDWFRRPAAGPFSGHWTRMTYAPNFREMTSTSLVDITGNGRPDIVMVESEYKDGRLSWFENRTLEDPAHPWVEHKMEGRFVYAHSLHAWREGNTVKFLLGEMDTGGWNAPRNYDARVMIYSSADNGHNWTCEIIDVGTGTHQALMADVDNDGLLEVLGKSDRSSTVQMWHQQSTVPLLECFEQKMLDRDKPSTAVEIVAVDLDGDGLQEVVCGKWWYRNIAAGTRYEIPGIAQVINAADIDGDGREELIAIKGNPLAPDFWSALNAEMVWLKPIDPLHGVWEEHYIGAGSGNWPHSSFFAPILPGGKCALGVGYYNGREHYPEYFAMPDDPRQSPWPRHVLAEIYYGEGMVPFDVDGDGKLDIVAGQYWLENQGDGTFKPYQFAEGLCAARLVVGDINNDGKAEVVIGEEVLDFEHRVTPLSRLVWFKIPDDPRVTPWEMHILDTLRCAHSVGLGDIDGDGIVEVIAGEHDPFWLYRQRCRLFAYKPADPHGVTWKRYVIDDRFEHHNGAKVVELTPGKPAIISHGWMDSIYVHVWERP